MNCPSPKCACEIPDDSFYCDQCGKELSKCQQCGSLVAGRFCPKDGSKTIALSQAIPMSPAPTVSSHQAPATLANATIRVPLGGNQVSKLKLIHVGGTILECSGETPLGRRAGPHAGFLAAFDTVSGTHGKVFPRGSDWIFVDSGSTNGSKVNGQPCVPNTEVPIHPGDQLELATQKFQIG